MLTRTDQANFLALARQGKIKPCLKSYCDTLLFFYLTYLAGSHQGSMLEIGIGGSSFALGEVSNLTQRRLHLVDIDSEGLKQVTNSSLCCHDLVTTWCLPSQQLPARAQHIGDLVYCHVDGSKNYVTTKSDLEFCLEHLAPMGLICQDDYGNNKWPTVTLLIHELVEQKLAKIILIGDSSIWITKPDFYDYWMQRIKTDTEMQLLGHFVGMCSTQNLLDTKEDYYFLNALTADHRYFDDKASVEYFDKLISLDHNDYLVMPYADQSTPGYFSGDMGNTPPYVLCQQSTWNSLRGEDWPQLAPQSRQHIDDLPHSVKQEITQQHRIELYAIDPFHSIFRRKKTKYQMGDTT